MKINIRTLAKVGLLIVVLFFTIMAITAFFTANVGGGLMFLVLAAIVMFGTIVLSKEQK